MKKTALFLAAASLAALAVAAAGSDQRTLKGQFVWDQGPTGNLRAVFEPTGDGKWDVDFHFKFRGRAHVYSGTATGNLADGKLEGRVKNESRRRTFTFRGEFEDGTFRGTHAEVFGERQRSTGTLTLSEGAMGGVAQ